MNRLWATRTLLPGARELEIQQLRDYVQMQEQKVEAERAKNSSPLRATPLTEGERRAIRERLAWHKDGKSAFFT